MSQSLSKFFVHLGSSTKHRVSKLPQTPFKELHTDAQGILKQQKCHMIEMNNLIDHVHGGSKGSRRNMRTSIGRRVAVPFPLDARSETKSLLSQESSSKNTLVFIPGKNSENSSGATKSNTASNMFGPRSRAARFQRAKP
jgi:hypothetical protein